MKSMRLAMTVARRFYRRARSFLRRLSARLSPSSPKQTVISGYDACGPRYNAARAHDPSPELARLLEVLPEHARVLDIGCGGGLPVTAALSRRANVVAVDISSVQIEQARKHVPEATFIVGDIMSQQFEPLSFDAIVAFYALFHLPREEHRSLLERIAAWLRPGGYFFATIANTDLPSYTNHDFFGVTMYWSHFEADWYTSTLRELRFDVLVSGVLDPGDRDVPGLPSDRHPVVFARLRPS